MVTIDFKPEMESRLAEQAAALGVSVEVFIQQIMESILGAPVPLESQQRKQRFHDWLKSHAHITAPPLSDEAISRDSIYGGREDRQL